jgi:DNA-directed RNA polymerase-3 subunit RPC5
MSRYVIGVVNNGELHLTPLSDVVQLRPCYGYLDNAESKAARGASASAGGAGGESSHDEGDDDARPVTVRFAPHESEDALARRMASYEHFKRQVDEEAWVNVRHCAIDSYESHIGRLHLMAEKKQESTEFYVTPAKFLSRLIPCPEAEVSAVASLPSNVLSLAALKAMPRDERIRSLMRSVRAIRFSELLSVLKSLGEQQLASSTEFVQDVLRHVQHCAVLVQGCWVVKSEMLYAKDSVSDQTGASSNVLRNARDYILYRFHLETRPDDRVVVTRRDVADNVGPLSTEDEREILDKIARRSAVKRGWEFRFERDQDFLGGEYFRYVGKAQDIYWQKQDLHWQKLQVS